MHPNQSGYYRYSPGRLMVLACLVLFFLVGGPPIVLATTPTPSPVPTASPTPAYGTSYLEMSDVKGMTLAHTRSSSTSGWYWYVVQADDPYTTSYGRVADSANTYFRTDRNPGEDGNAGVSDPDHQPDGPAYQDPDPHPRTIPHPIAYRRGQRDIPGPGYGRRLLRSRHLPGWRDHRRCFNPIPVPFPHPHSLTPTPA